MELITRGTNNTVILTLTEKVTVTGPYFLVKATSRRTNQIKRFLLASNLSGATERYDQFTITETSGTEILTSGTVTLTGGDWWYEVYEQTSSSNLLETASTNTVPIEKGIFRVIDDQDTYVATDTGDTYVT
jgi:hypothetical protein